MKKNQSPRLRRSIKTWLLGSILGLFCATAQGQDGADLNSCVGADSISQTNSCSGQSSGSVTFKATATTSPSGCCTTLDFVRCTLRLNNTIINTITIPIANIANEFTFNGLAPNTYNLRVRGYDNNANQCDQEDIANFVTITVLPAPNLNPIVPASPQLTCSISSVSLSTTSPPANTTLIWQFPDGAQTADYPLQANTAGTYLLIGTDNTTGCKDTVSVVVTQNNTGGPTASVSPTSAQITCTSPTVTLIASNVMNADSWEWCDDDDNCTPNILSLVVSSPGTYTFRVKKGSCEQEYNAVVTSDANIPVISFSPPAPFFCKSEGSGQVTASATGGGPFTYKWSNGPLTAQNTVSTAATYFVTVTDTDNGCSVVDMVEFEEIDPMLDTPLDLIVEENVFLTINPTVTPSPGGYVTWRLSEFENLSQITGDTSSHFGQIFNKYLIDDKRSLGGVRYTLTPMFGTCKGEPVTVNVSVKPSSADPFIPEIYTPNGDGQNDIWQVALPDGAEGGDYAVYNRLGGKVMDGNVLETPWDGSGCPDGTYFYVLRYNVNGAEVVKKGAVTILRTTD